MIKLRFQANKALQVQLQVVPSGHVKAVSRVKGFFLPITINNENVMMPTNITDAFKEKVQAAYTVANYVESIGPFLGCAILAISLVRVFKLRLRLRDQAETAETADTDDPSASLIRRSTAQQ